MTDDPAALDLGADHEARDIGEVDERDIEGVAGPDEPGRLVGRVGEEHPALDRGVVRDDPDGLPREMPEADDELSGCLLYTSRCV